MSATQAALSTVRSETHTVAVEAFDNRLITARLLLEICDGTVTPANAMEANELRKMLIGNKPWAAQSPDEQTKAQCIGRLFDAVVNQVKAQPKGATLWEGVKDSRMSMFGNGKTVVQMRALNALRDALGVGEIDRPTYETIRNSVIQRKVAKAALPKDLPTYVLFAVEAVADGRSSGRSWLLSP